MGNKRNSDDVFEGYFCASTFSFDDGPGKTVFMKKCIKNLKKNFDFILDGKYKINVLKMNPVFAEVRDFIIYITILQYLF